MPSDLSIRLDSVQGQVVASQRHLPKVVLADVAQVGGRVDTVEQSLCAFEA